MKAINKMTQGELAAYIDTHLRKNGISVVLSGGASVAVYSDHLYVSKDLDFVAQFTLNQSRVNDAMQELGFEKKVNYFFHQLTEYFVEFVPGPPSVGKDPIERIDELEMSTGILRVISPTDCVKDRLAAYYHWGDRQGLKQAVLVAKTNEIDMGSVESWSQREGKQAEFGEFKQLSKKMSQ